MTMHIRPNLRFLLLATVSIAAGAAAFVLAPAAPPAAPDSADAAAVPTAPVTPTARTETILVAARSIAPGATLTDEDLAWREWPADSVPEGSYVKGGDEQTVVGAAALSAIGSGEALTRSRLANPGNAGFLAAILDRGMRAVAIPLDVSGGQSAGGFVRPQDHVDLIVSSTSRSAGGAPGVRQARVLLADVRVLAIGSHLSGAPATGQPTLQGATATLEVTPAQALILAETLMKTGETDLSLALRPTGERQQSSPSADPSSIITIRYGSVQ
ncbi:Flp pilus assembly protein CpaB [Xanthobacter sp. V13C-7B]|uniref:Flp pilus assembly protein CpaB n=1 Tax=Xanthobacter variabilis TaxID=3119932 RepID=UPI00372C4D1A